LVERDRVERGDRFVDELADVDTIARVDVRARFEPRQLEHAADELSRAARSRARAG
jgi:hypothetical protein